LGSGFDTVGEMPYTAPQKKALEKLLQSDSQTSYLSSLKSLALIEREPKS